MLLSRSKNVLASPRFPRVAVLVACALSLPSLATGLVLDDLWHRAKMLGGRDWSPSREGAFTLFEFLQGTPDEHARLIEKGFAPWWTAPGLRLSFFRPLSCLTHALDYALWPQSPALMHVHSILWYAALLAVAAVLFRRLLPPLAANVAFLFYAIDPTHALPVSWIANRNALVAGVFALGALALWDAKKSWLAGLALALGLAAGESASAVLGFFVAHWLFIERRPLRAFVPIAAAVVAWFIAYRVGHHGVVGSGVYTDPIRSPLSYAKNVVVHVPLLLATELGGASPDPFPFFPAAGKVAFYAFAVVMLAWAALVFRRFDAEHRAKVRFFALGSVLAVFPGCAAFPSGRLLLLPGFGLVALAGLLCATPAEGRSARIFRGWMWAKHALFAPLLYVIALFDMALVDGMIRRFTPGIPIDGSAADKRLVLVNAADTAFAYYMIVNPLEEGHSPPRRLLIMAGNQRDIRITRTAERTVAVHEDGGFYRANTEVLFRDPRIPFAVGDRIEQSDARITITHVLPDGTPDDASVEFTRDLDAGYLFRAWKDRTLVPFTLPAVGESVLFPGRMLSPF